MSTRIVDFFNRQMSLWDDAKQRYQDLEHVLQQEMFFDNFPIRLQCNPSRIISTGAKVDNTTISQRPCFLCSKNRPDVQIVDKDIVKGYDFLINPFPIFKYHFTIADVEHHHQDEVDFRVLVKFAKENPGFVAFYNGSASGASAPDHLHFQAGNIDFLPICDYVTKGSGVEDDRFVDYKVRCYPHLPMKFIHFTLSTTDESLLVDVLRRIDAIIVDKSKLNVLMFSRNPETIEILLFPRRQHRPSCYYAENQSQLMVSPGAVDMAGVLILPRIKDYESITYDDIVKIYDEVGVSHYELKVMVDKLLSN